MTVEDSAKSRTELLAEVASLRAEVAELCARAGPSDEAARRIRASEERYRAFIEQTAEAIWRCELSVGIPVTLPADEQVRRILATAYLAECNDVMARMYGFSVASEIVGTALTDLLDPGDPANVAYLRAFVDSGYRMVEAESHERARDGSDRYFLNNLIGIVEDGHLTRAWGTQRDVTGRRVIEEALRRSEARFRSIIESNMLGIGFREPDGGVSYANDALLQTIGYAREDFDAGRIDWRGLTPPEYYASDEKAFAQTESLGWCTPYEKAYVRRDGSRVPVLVGGASFGDDRTRGAFFVADLTDRRRAEDALRESEARFRLAVSAAGLLLFGCDRELRYTWAYNAHPDFTAEGLLGRRDEDLLPPAEAERVVALKRGVLESGVPARGETTVTLSDGEHTYQLDVHPLIDDAGEITGVMTAGRDITAERRAAAAVRHAQKLESIGVLAGGIAHDFNNLLTGIMGNATLVARMLSPASASRAAPMLDDVVRAAQRAADLTSQLLAYAGKGRFFVRQVDLGTLTGDIASLLRSSIPRKVELRLTIDPLASPIDADASQVQQLVMNLVLNGAEAIGDETGTVSVDVRDRVIDAAEAVSHFGAFGLVPGRYVILEVVDSGCGMDQATQARIYDPFFTTKFTGRGLGLAAALGIVRGHHGAITVRSAPGQGTTFVVAFPAAEVVAPAAPPPQEAVPDAGGEGLILVVDDEDVVRRTARLTLDEYGYDVLTAADGAEAVDVFRRYGSRIRLVVLDMTMPVMGGEETIGHLRAIDPGIPVLAMSGYGEAEAMRRFDRTPADGFLQKPFAAPALAAAVRTMLGASRARPA